MGSGWLTLLPFLAYQVHLKHFQSEELTNEKSVLWVKKIKDAWQSRWDVERLPRLHVERPGSVSAPADTHPPSVNINYMWRFCPFDFYWRHVFIQSSGERDPNAFRGMGPKRLQGFLATSTPISTPVSNTTPTSSQRLSVCPERLAPPAAPRPKISPKVSWKTETDTLVWTTSDLCGHTTEIWKISTWTSGFGSFSVQVQLNSWFFLA